MDLTKLIKKFKTSFKLDNRVATVLAILVVAIIKYRTVNLTKLIPCFWMKKAETRYKRLQRFFRNFRFDEKLLAEFMVWVLWKKWPYVLSMDRTNRKYWKADINILTIWIVYKWIAFPVLRKLLLKRWNSNTDERIDITNKFLEIFWKDSIWLLLADREFIWRDRVLWLIEKKVEFILRVRNNTKVEVKWWSKHIFKSFKYDQKYNVRSLKKKRTIRWISLYITWMKTEDEYLIVITPTKHSNAILEYGLRREIETLFWCIKSRWFNFEETHITDPDRISTMMGVLSIAFARSHLTWEERILLEWPIPIKKHWRKQQSIFRYGLDLLRDIFEDFIAYSDRFNIVLRIMSCT